MSKTEQDIYSTPSIIRQTIERVAQHRETLLPFLEGPAVFLGCGSSYCVALAAAALYETTFVRPAQGIMASDYQPRPDWTHLAISRSGQTTELIEAIQRARAAGARVALVEGDPGSPAGNASDAIFSLDFATEEGVIQTRFVVASLLALRLLIGGETAISSLAALPDRLEAALHAVDVQTFVRFDHVVFLGRGWRYGVALAAALNLQETALMAPEGHQTLEYRHGPMARADEGTFVWCFDPEDDAASMAVLDDVRATGATVWQSSDDPLIAMSQAQLLAVHMATVRGVDPDAPRHLQRAIVLPASGM